MRNGLKWIMKASHGELRSDHYGKSYKKCLSLNVIWLQYPSVFNIAFAFSDSLKTFTAFILFVQYSLYKLSSLVNKFAILPPHDMPL